MRGGFCQDGSGASAVEFAIVAPVFVLLLFAAIEGGLLLWTQLGLQHGVEVAARCASVNAGLCGSTAAIQDFAARQAFGLNVPPSTFSVSTPACGNQVSANYA